MSRTVAKPLTNTTPAELQKAKRLWEAGLNDRQVGDIMGWSNTKAYTVRIFLRMPPNRKWAPR